MACGSYNLDINTENLRKQLALAVTSIQWSYAIYWSISARDSGVLEWCDGYYNGNIKTRKTVQSIELNAEQPGLQRSEQLRELYQCLSTGEAIPEARRPSAALSPEDLSDAEWYYLVCMSFVFNIGQDLPGRTLENGRPTWLCNAQNADSKVFSRSLLAKSAGVQTVVCFPFLRGVIELGVTELVLEDPSLIEHVKASFLEIPDSILMDKTCRESDNELNHPELDHRIFDDRTNPFVDCEGLDVPFTNNSSNNLKDKHPISKLGMHQGGSQVQSWEFIDHGVSDCVRQSMDISDSISKSIADTVKVVTLPTVENRSNHCFQEAQDSACMKSTALDLQSNDLHYQRVVSCLLKTSDPLMLRACSQKRHLESSFVGWKRVSMVPLSSLQCRTPQNLLKKILFGVPRMHVDCLLDSREDSIEKVGLSMLEADEIVPNHSLSERIRREKITQRFMVLKSILPWTSKVDKVSILDHAIEYLLELERRIKELESCKELITGLEESTKGKHQDAAEGTSESYGRKRTGSEKSTLANKRKASEVNGHGSTNGSDVAVIINDEQVMVEIKCSWREGILLEIMDAVSYLHLDSHSVQSSTIDGIFWLTMKSKHGGSGVMSARRIKQVLQRVADKS